MTKEIIDRHCKRLESHYKKKNIQDSLIPNFINIKRQKMENLRNDSFEDYSLFFKSDNFKEVIGGTKDPISLVDIGCGSGELIFAMSKIYKNIRFFGVEPYSEECDIAKSLFLDSKTECKLYKNLYECVSSNKIDVATFFSVTEHLSKSIFDEILKDLSEKNVKKIFILVPNFFKIRDDHTSLPYLSLLGHKLSAFIVKILKKPYLLSDGSNWDVWYRSASEYESILNSYGYKVDFLTEKIFPSLSVSPPLKLNIFSFRVLKDLKYLPLILFRIFKKKHFADKYPYLNMIAYSEKD